MMRLHIFWQGVSAVLMIAILSSGSSLTGSAYQNETEGTRIVENTNGIQVAQELLAEFQASGSASYLIYFNEKPELSGLEQMDWLERGRYVYAALSSAAERSQAATKEVLNREGVGYQSFWIDNVILVENSDIRTFNRLLQISEIREVKNRRVLSVIEPDATSQPAASLAIEANLLRVNADEAWALGIDGSGIVVANIDTGVRYTHTALINQYRGNLGGGSFQHNYNWYDPYQQYYAPADGNGHGTHVMGTMVGSDGGANQIGMAPGADWIACRGCSTSTCSDAALLACAEFVAAPTNTAGNNPDPDKRAHVVNNSWGDCDTSYDNWYQGVIDSWHAFGVYPIFANGNAGNCQYSAPPGLNTVGNPARYGNVTGVGSTGKSDGLYATHSNWGPTDNLDAINPRGYGSLKPQVVAPGVSIRSSVSSYDNAYGSFTGTSMSAPHVAGLIALVWQAGPNLIGDYAATETLIEQTAVPVPYASGGIPVPGPGNLPNYATGWGEIDALAAVKAAFCEGGGAINFTQSCISVAPEAFDIQVAAGFSLTEPLILFNTGTVEGAFEISLADPGDSNWLTFAPASGNIPGGSSQKIEVTLSTLPEMVVGDTREAALNIVTNDPVNANIEIPVSMVVVEEAYGVEVSPDLEGSGAAGRSLTYTIAVKNTGTVADTYLLSLEGGEWEAELSEEQVSLNPGKSAGVIVTVVVPAEAEVGEADSVVFKAESSLKAGTEAISQITSRVKASSSDLGVAIGISPQVIVLGRPSTFAITVSNIGPDDASGVVVSGVLPDQIAFVSSENCTNEDNEIACDLGDIENSGSKISEITLRFLAAGPFEVSVVVTGSEDDPNLANNSDFFIVEVEWMKVFAPLITRNQ